MKDRPVAETSTGQHTTLTREIHVPGGTRTRNPNKRSAADPGLRPLGHWDQHDTHSTVKVRLQLERNKPINRLKGEEPFCKILIRSRISPSFMETEIMELSVPIKMIYTMGSLYSHYICYFPTQKQHTK